MFSIVCSLACFSHLASSRSLLSSVVSSPFTLSSMSITFSTRSKDQMGKISKENVHQINKAINQLPRWIVELSSAAKRKHP